MDSTPPPVTSAAAPPLVGTVTEDKTVAILCYLTLIGFIVAIVMHSSKKTRLGAYHLRQMLGIFLTAAAAVLCQVVLLFIPILGWLAIFAMWIAIVVLWLMGFLAALKGEMKPAPFLGPMYQKWFGDAFN